MNSINCKRKLNPNKLNPGSLHIAIFFNESSLCNITLRKESHLPKWFSHRQLSANIFARFFGARSSCFVTVRNRSSAPPMEQSDCHEHNATCYISAVNAAINNERDLNINTSRLYPRRNPRNDRRFNVSSRHQFIWFSLFTVRCA